MKKITKYKINQEHLLMSLLQSLLYWMTYDLDTFLNENRKHEKKILKNIGEICIRKNNLRKIINILSNIDAEIQCSSEKERINAYSDFSIELARKVIEKPILDYRSEDIKETLMEEHEEFENSFMKSYINLLDENDPGYMFMSITNDLEDILNLILVLQNNETEYNNDKSKEIIIKINVLKSKVLSIKEEEDFAHFLLDEISRIKTRQEDIKANLAEDIISQWLNIFDKVIFYCDNILDALNDQNLEKIYEKSLEIEWVNLNAFYSSLYMLRGYFYLTEYTWVPVSILSSPDIAGWEEVI